MVQSYGGVKELEGMLDIIRVLNSESGRLWPHVQGGDRQRHVLISYVSFLGRALLVPQSASQTQKGGRRGQCCFSRKACKILIISTTFRRSGLQMGQDRAFDQPHWLEVEIL